MPSERIDHFAAMRVEEAPQAEPPEGSPVVTPELIEWLEETFQAAPIGPATGMDDGVSKLCEIARQYGNREVIAHLRNLVRIA